MSRAVWATKEHKFGPPTYIFYLGNIPMGSCTKAAAASTKGKAYVKFLVPMSPAVEARFKELGGPVQPSLEKAQEVLVFVIDTWIYESTLRFTSEDE